MNDQVITAQKLFDEKYISASEIAKECDVSRPTVHRARQRGMLPDAILVNDKDIHVWERDKIAPWIDAWKKALSVKRRGANA